MLIIRPLVKASYLMPDSEEQCGLGWKCSCLSSQRATIPLLLAMLGPQGDNPWLLLLLMGFVLTGWFVPGWDNRLHSFYRWICNFTCEKTVLSPL